MTNAERFFQILIFAVFACFAARADASTLVLGGRMDNEAEITEERVFTVPSGGLGKLTFRFANPAPFKSASFNQDVSGRRVDYSPRPDAVSIDKDGFGNTFTTVTWKGLRGNAVVTETFTVRLGIGLDDIKSAAPYPVARGSVPADAGRFLSATKLVESGSGEIKNLALKLSDGLSSEQAVVMSVLNWVVDNIKYKTPVEEYGALWTLEKRHGNCQNFSHLSAALLRASGIPARVVGGISLGRTWRVPLADGALVQSIGQGGHAWMEVWYPDLGWVPYDAQQSHLFVGPRHIRQTAGLDSGDINDSWRASPELPHFRDTIRAGYVKDIVAINLKETTPDPANYIMTSSLAPLATKATEPLAASAPPLLQTPPEPPAPPMEMEPSPPPASGTIEFGNTDFPALEDLYARVRDGRGEKTFDKETAEYVTGEHAFAQAFVVESPMEAGTVSLAMHKFGGRAGSLWIDVVKDADGRPGMDGVRSLPLSLDSVRYHPGYRWFDFSFARAGEKGPVLTPGRYWIILRHSRDAVVNWFYTPGNQYGGPDDSRSTAEGTLWPDIMNYDFNFRVRGALAR